jgi:hypothetical protein
VKAVLAEPRGRGVLDRSGGSIVAERCDRERRRSIADRIARDPASDRTRKESVPRETGGHDQTINDDLTLIQHAPDNSLCIPTQQ